MNLAAQLLENTFHAVWRFLCKLYYPYRHLIGALVLLIFTVMTVAVIAVYPKSNWDMIAYVAAVLEGDISDPVALHDKTYDLVKQDISAGEYLTLTEDRPYRIRQAQDPAAFYTMLGFYRMKIAYIETAKFLTRFTDPVTGLRLISLVSTAAFGLLLLRWLGRYKLLSAGPIVVAMINICGIYAVAADVTPDMFATFFLLLAFYLYCEKQDLLAALCLILSMFIRPDHLAFIGVFFVFTAIYGPGRFIMTATFALCVAAYFFILRDEGYPGWWVHLWFSHVEYVETLEGFDPPFSILIYLQILVRAIVRSLSGETWIAILLAQVIFFIRCINVPAMPERPKVLLYAIFASILAKYIVFPHFETRFYFPYLVGMGMILLVARMRQERGLMS